MSLEDDLKAVSRAADVKRVEAQIPKTWRAHTRTLPSGNVEVTTPATADEQTDRRLLEEAGYDPDKFMVTGRRHSTWESPVKGGEPVKLHAYKFQVTERPATAADVDSVVHMIESWEPVKRERFRFDGAECLLVGDLQLSKAEAPIEDVAQRVIAHIDRFAEDLENATSEHVHMAWLGDCIEGQESQGGRLRWRTTATMTEQVRVLQRLMMYGVKVLAPLCDRLTVVSVPGNHDEANRRDLDTRVDDSWAVQALVSVDDAIRFTEKPELSHVECYVPGPDEHSVVMEVGGMLVAHTHGHIFRLGKEMDWWKGQAFGGQPEGQATLLLHGHQHHWQVEERGQRTRICVPALENESVWWKHKAGDGGNPGSLRLSLAEGKVQAIARYGDTPNDEETQ